MSESVGPLLAMVVLGWFFYTVTITWRRSRIIKAQSEVRTKILEKIGSGGEMLDFMKTESGQRLLEPLPMEKATPQGFTRILRAVQAGVIMVSLGSGILLLNESVIRDNEALLFGGVTLALGVGFLLAGGASYVLSKNWGLLETRESE